ncbi:MAG: HpaII family restriction endonuclease [Elusimicrobiota bacterium]
MSISKNKGEWSELYAFLKILGEKNIRTSVSSSKYAEFTKLIRECKGKKIIYEIESPYSNIKIKVLSDEFIFEGSKLRKILPEIFKKIKYGEGRSFQLGNEFWQELKTLKIGDIRFSRDRKSDFYGVLQDPLRKTETEELGFSVKSKIGGSATLLNAGKTTNFVYLIAGIKDQKEKEEINSIKGKSKIKDRIKKLIDNKYEIKFHKTEKDIFEKNLRMIDSLLPEIISDMLKIYYSGKATKVKEIIEKILKEESFSNRFKFLEKEMLEFKIKNFLEAVALGMVPGKLWDGFFLAKGGCLIVEDDGELVCYYMYNRDELRKYLYENTRFESPSSERHCYGKIYEKCGSFYINLNLQIRF